MRINLAISGVLFLAPALAPAQSQQTDRNLEALRFKTKLQKYQFAVADRLRVSHLQELGLMSDYEGEVKELNAKVALNSLKEATYMLLSANQAILIESALKAVDVHGLTTVTIRLSNPSGSEFPDYLKDVQGLQSDWNSWLDIRNLRVSLVMDGLNIADPYQMVVDVPKGDSSECVFRLLREVSRITVKLSYNGRVENLELLLAQDPSKPAILIRPTTFSQSIEDAGTGEYRLGIEGYGVLGQEILLSVRGLPESIRSEFVESMEGQENIVRKIRLTENEPRRDLSLRLHMPELAAHLESADIIQFFAVASVTMPHTDGTGKILSWNTMLEVIPKGRADVEIALSNMYFEIRRGEDLSFDVSIKNTGTASLLNPRIEADVPGGWNLLPVAGLPSTIGGQETVSVRTVFAIPTTEASGDYHLKIRCTGDNLDPSTRGDERLVRVSLLRTGRAFQIGFLLLLLGGGVSGALIWLRKNSLR